MAIGAAIGGSLLGAYSSRKASKRAAKSQERGQEQSMAYQKEAATQARGDAIPLYNSAQDNAMQGYQSALDVFGQTVPQQMQAFQGGNVNAQNTLLAGLPQQNAAILGQQYNPNALQTQSVALPDQSMFQQQLPDFTTINQALKINQEPENQYPNINFPVGSWFGQNFNNWGNP